MALLGLHLGSFPAPSYPAAAVLSVGFLYWWWAPERPNQALAAIVGIALVSVIVIVAVSSVFDRGAVSGKGDAAKAFARQAQTLVGSDPVAFVDLGISAAFPDGTPPGQGRTEACRLPSHEARRDRHDADCRGAIPRWEMGDRPFYRRGRCRIP
jgi:hypothetical protein